MTTEPVRVRRNSAGSFCHLIGAVDLWPQTGRLEQNDRAAPSFHQAGALRRTLTAAAVEIVKRSVAKAFVALPKRWIVERPLPGLAAAGGWPGTGSASTTKRSPSSASPPSASRCEHYIITNEVSGLTHRFNVLEHVGILIMQEECLNHEALASTTPKSQG